MATRTTETFGQIETNAAHRPPQLRREVTILTLYGINNWTSQGNNAKREFYN